MLTIHRAGEDKDRIAYTLLRTDTIVGGFPSDADLKKYWEETRGFADKGFRVLRRAHGSLALSLPCDVKEQVAQQFGKNLRSAMQNHAVEIQRP